MHGRDAAALINGSLMATTIHRRGVQKDGKFIDCHCRISDAVVSSCHFTTEYLEALGLELASLDRHVYEELIVVLRSRLGDGEITGFGQQPLLVSDGDLYNLFPRIRTTLLFSLLRNMMGKFSYRMATFLKDC